MTVQAFSEDAVQRAIEASKQYEPVAAYLRGEPSTLSDDAHLLLLAECLSVGVEDGKVCVRLPLGIGDVCLPIPLPVPNGTAAQACLKICTTWGIPTGVKLTISVLGNVVVEKSFGKC